MTRVFMSVIVIGFVIIIVSGTSVAEGQDKNNALMNAAGIGKAEEVQRLLNEGADVNARQKFSTPSGMTSLIWASQRGYPDVVNVLLDKGADVNAKHQYGGTALMETAWEGSLDVVQFLLEKGADVHAKDSHHKTALMLAFDKDNFEIVKVLKTHMSEDRVRLGGGMRGGKLKPTRFFSGLW